MVLQNGDFIKDSDICYLSAVKLQRGERKWNANMTRELVYPDSYYFEVKLSSYELSFSYKDEADAIKDHDMVLNALQSN